MHPVVVGLAVMAASTAASLVSGIHALRSHIDPRDVGAMLILMTIMDTITNNVVIGVKNAARDLGVDMAKAQQACIVAGEKAFDLSDVGTADLRSEAISRGATAKTEDRRTIN